MCAACGNWFATTHANGTSRNLSPMHLGLCGMGMTLEDVRLRTARQHPEMCLLSLPCALSGIRRLP